MDIQRSYLCGYLKIKGLTEEFQVMTTFFDGEIIGSRYPFLTRKWDADETVCRRVLAKLIETKNKNHLHLRKIMTTG